MHAGGQGACETVTGLPAAEGGRLGRTAQVATVERAQPVDQVRETGVLQRVRRQPIAVLLAACLAGGAWMT